MFPTGPLSRLSPKHRLPAIFQLPSATVVHRRAAPLRSSVWTSTARTGAELEQFHFQGSADFSVCCIAGFQTRRPNDRQPYADLEIGDAAGLETCVTA
jgi:hypothetical protein